MDPWLCRLSQGVTVSIGSQETLILGLSVYSKLVTKVGGLGAVLGIKAQRAIRKPDELLEKFV